VAIPSQSNYSVGTIPLPESSSCFPNSSFNPAISTVMSTYKATGTGATTVVNFSSDTFLHTADGGIWDDTAQCWIPVDKTRLNENNQRNNY
jgi:hypothetical protein